MVVAVSIGIGEGDSSLTVINIAMLRLYSRGNRSKGLRPQLVRCAPFLSIALLKARNDEWVRARPDVSSTVLL
jgi:hypothetical protein